MPWNIGSVVLPLKLRIMAASKDSIVHRYLM